MQYNLLKSIFSSYWHIAPSALESLSPIIMNVIEGKAQRVDKAPVSVSIYGESMQASSMAFGESAAASGRQVVVYPIRSVLTKSDTWCDYGMESINANLKALLARESVVGIVLDMDTPGGEASYMPILQNTIRNASKPIVAYYNNMCASAGYGLASQAREIYASLDTDQIGSIGTMISFYDYAKWMEKEGIEYKSFYATKSTKKNEFWRKMDTEEGVALITADLDHFNEAFIASVRGTRNITNEEVFTGKMYTGQVAMKNGMIDGIMSLEDCVERVFELAEAPTNTANLNANKTMSKHVQTVASFLGFTGLETKDGHISLRQEDVEKIGAALESGQAAATELEAANVQETATVASINSINETLGTIQGTLESIQATQASQNERLQTLETVVPGAAPASTVVADANAEDLELEPWEDPNHPLNQSVGKL